MSMKEIKIIDWNDFNYQKVMFDISDIVNHGYVSDLIMSLKENYINHLYDLERAINSNRLIYIENCDLQYPILHWNRMKDYKIYKLRCNVKWNYGSRELYFYYNESDEDE